LQPLFQLANAHDEQGHTRQEQPKISSRHG
jgi:hypothetical protein